MISYAALATRTASVFGGILAAEGLEPHTVSFGDCSHVDVRPLDLSHPPKVVQPTAGRFRPHPVHRRDRSVHEARDLGRAAQGIDQGRGKGAHDGGVAITASFAQLKTCYSDNCHSGNHPLDRAMPYEDVRSRMDALGYKQVDLANLLGLTPPQVSKAFAGKRRFTSEEMDKIRHWLGGSDAPAPGRAVGTIPVVGRVTAGSLREAASHAIGEMHKPDPSIPDHALALDVEGDSMDLFVPDGGRIIYDPQDRSLWPRRFYVVLNSAGETTFKRFYADPARLEPCSTNKDHRTIELGGEETFTIVGRVIWQASRMPD